MEDEVLGKGLKGEFPDETTAVQRVDPAARELPAQHPSRDISLGELADRPDALEVIAARVKILETVRKAAIRATSPEDWLLFKDRKGAVIGYLQDCGADRVRDLYGIEIYDISKPEKKRIEASEDFMYLITGCGRCSLTHQTLESIEGGRSSRDDFVRDLDGVELELAVRKAARANLDGNITRELAGLKSVPLSDLQDAWKGTTKDSSNCRLGRGFGSQAERRGADMQTGAPGVTQSEAPNCPKCGGTMKFVAGKEGKYEAFWSCAKYSSGDCDGTRKFEKPGQPDKKAPDPAAEKKSPSEETQAESYNRVKEEVAQPAYLGDDPGPQEEGVSQDDINFGPGQ